MAITWKNIDPPDLRGAAAITGAGARSLSSAFDNARKMIGDYQDQQAANWDAGKASNTNEAVARIMGTNTLDQYNSLRDELTTGGGLAQYGKQIDLVKAMEALNQRDNDIRTDVTEGQQFEVSNAQFKDRDVLSQAIQGIQTGQITSANQLDSLLTQAAPETRSKASELFRTVTQGDATHKANLASTWASVAGTNANTAATKQRTSFDKDTHDLGKRTREHTEGLARFIQETSLKPETSARTTLDAANQYVTDNNIPMAVALPILGKVNEMYLMNNGANKEEVASFNEVERLLAEEHASKVIAPLDKELSDIQTDLDRIPTFVKEPKKYSNISDIMNTAVNDLKLRNSVWGSDRGIESLNDVLNETMPTLVKEAASTYGITDHRLVYGAMNQALLNVGANDVDDDGKGEINFSTVKDEYRRLLSTVHQDDKKLTELLEKQTTKQKRRDAADSLYKSGQAKRAQAILDRKKLSGFTN